jgi:hypothetical protein
MSDACGGCHKLELTRVLGKHVGHEGVGVETQENSKYQTANDKTLGSVFGV